MPDFKKYERWLLEGSHRRRPVLRGTAILYVDDAQSFERSGLSAAAWISLPPDKRKGGNGKLSPSRFNGRRASLVAWFEYCGRSLEELPMGKRKKGRPRVILNQDEVDSLLVAFEEGPRRERVFARLTYASGCRRKELIEALVEHLDLDNRTLQVCGKGDDWRTVYFDEYTARMIELYLRIDRVEQHPSLGAPRLFVSDRGRQYQPGVIVGAVRAAALRAGLDKVATCDRPVHIFRRCYLTHMAETERFSTFELAELAGHKDPRTTQGYIDQAPALQRRKYDQAHPLARNAVGRARRIA